MFYSDEEITYDMAQKKLLEINYLLDQHPRDKELYYQKAKYFYYSFLTSPTRLTDGRDMDDLYRRLSQLYFMILPMDHVSLDILYSYSSLLYRRRFFEEFILVLEHSNLVELSGKPENEQEYHMYCDLLYLLMISYSKTGRKADVIKLLPICRSRGLDFRAETAEYFLLHNPRALREIFLTDNLELNLASIQAVLAILPEQYLPERLYKAELVQLNTQLEHFMYLCDTESLLNILTKFEEKNGKVFLSQLYLLWLKEGAHYPEWEQSLDGIPLHLHGITSIVPELYYNSFINKLLQYEPFSAVENRFLRELTDCLFSTVNLPDDAAFRDFRFIYLFIIKSHRECLPATFYIAAILCRKFHIPDLSIPYYKKAYLLAEEYNYPVSDRLLLLMDYADTLLSSRLYFQAINALTNAESLLLNISDANNIIRFYSLKRSCLVKLEDYESALKCYDCILSHPAIPTEEKLEISEEKKHFYELWFLQGASFIYESPHSYYKTDYFTIPQLFGRPAVTIAYTSKHELYDNLLNRWDAYLRDRDKIYDRNTGIIFFTEASRIFECLVALALDIGAAILAIQHIEDFRCASLIMNAESLTKHEKKWEEEERFFVRSDKNIFTLEFYYSSYGCWCFVCNELQRSLNHVIRFPNVTETEINSLAKELYEDELYKSIAPGWDEPCLRDDHIQKFHLWIEKLDRLFYVPVQKTLEQEKIDELVIIPYRSLHGFPLNLLGYSHGWKQCLTHRYPITFSPNLRIFRALQTHPKNQNVNHALFVTNSLDSFSSPKADPRALRGAEWEGNIIADLLKENGIPSIILSRESANYKEVTQNIPSVQIIHVGCHGIHDASIPEKSGVLLHENNLTLDDLWKEIDLSNCQFINLSSCHLGKTQYGENIDITDEFTGFVNGVLYAGASNVLSSISVINESFSFVFNYVFYSTLINNPFCYADTLKKTLECLIEMELADAEKILSIITDQEVRTPMSKTLNLLCDLSKDEKHPFENPIVWSKIRIHGRG